MITFIVLGFHRSGTSLVANTLYNLGVHMGTRLLPASDGNKKGFYENAEFVKLNDRILELAGGSWFNPPSVEAIQAAGDILDQPIYNCLKRASSVKDTWGWKDPRTCLTFQCYEPHLYNMGGRTKLVYVFRQRDSVWKSFKSRRLKAKSPIERAVTEKHFDHIYRDYTERTILALDKYAEVFDIFYDDFLQRSDNYAKRLVKFVTDKAPTQEEINIVKKTIDPTLRRF